MAKIRHASLTVPSPDTWAAAAAAAIRPNAASVVPYWPHAVQDWLIHALPEWALDAYLMTMRKGLRRAFLKKHAEKQAGGAGAAASAEQPASQGGKKRE
jgi:17beta-estradiol 17-dehydrogenase / very-long-chain 3-oxoacyl-CoA reductase